MKRERWYLLMAIVVSMVLKIASADAAHGVRPADGPIENRARVCMLQDTIQPKDGLPQEYAGKTYYLCCGGCRAAFNNDPAQFSHAVDPVTGRSVDKAEVRVYGYHGRAYFFDSAQSLSAFEADPRRYVKQGRAD